MLGGYFWLFSTVLADCFCGYYLFSVFYSRTACFFIVLQLQIRIILNTIVNAIRLFIASYHRTKYPKVHNYSSPWRNYEPIRLYPYPGEVGGKGKGITLYPRNFTPSPYIYLYPPSLRTGVNPPLWAVTEHSVAKAAFTLDLPWQVYGLCKTLPVSFETLCPQLLDLIQAERDGQWDQANTMPDKRQWDLANTMWGKRSQVTFQKLTKYNLSLNKKFKNELEW